MDLFLPIIRDIQHSRFSTLAASTIIVYDHLITFDQEIELVWNAPWSMGKILFFLNRYYPLCVVAFNQYTLFTTDLTDELCMIWLRWQGWSALGACMIAEIILQLRLYALYFLDKKVLFFMVVSFLATSACSAFIMGKVLSNFTVQSHLIPGLPFCIPIKIPSYLYAFWIPILAFESLLCGMALFRGFQAFRYRRSVFQAGRHLVTLLLRDSIIYYLVVFVTYLVNLLLWSTGEAGLIEIPAGFTIAMSCVMGNRLILNVRCMKREMEDSIEGEKSIFHLPLTTNDAARNQTPSMVEFVKAPTTPLSPDSQSDFESMEMRDMGRDSPSYGYVMAI
jgi:hypothetical protein